MKREVVIIGGGPAGLAAAIEAKKDGCDVLLVDENRRAGGQLFKQLHKFFGSRAHRARRQRNRYRKTAPSGDGRTWN